MLRNNLLSVILRSKCIELICLVYRLLQSAEQNDQVKSATKMLTDKLNTYLGAKLAEEMRVLFNKKMASNASSQSIHVDLEPSAFDHFVDKIDQRFR